ncbi:hypothetical protein AKJ42_01920 [candidate division MSBL1 archaeon SCGC-AAA261C02]|uniref:Uncharacterized protein n=1 Tax=candidate division MSBL1 archaeon SCGC-AAA261C02 TaxID=1698272 RepID=A0A133V0Q1_9EURY|nr:hypothetical protein AKJ42_01920 [candidate division MSBL1 archaeon SCGC-AAA261C02]
MLREKPWLTDAERERLRMTGRPPYGEYLTSRPTKKERSGKRPRQSQVRGVLGYPDARRLGTWN